MITLTGTFVFCTDAPLVGASYVLTLIVPNRVSNCIAQTKKSGKLDNSGSFSLSLEPGDYDLLINGTDDFKIRLPNVAGSYDVKDIQII